MTEGELQKAVLDLRSTDRATQKDARRHSILPVTA